MNWGRSLYLRAGLWNGGCRDAFMVRLVEEPENLYSPLGVSDRVGVRCMP